MTDIQEVYTLFDKDNDGAIATRDVIAVLRSLGYNPAEKEVKQLLEEFDAEGKFIAIMDTYHLISMIMLL